MIQGESTAIVGEPRTGKTSLLLYLAADETRFKLYGDTSAELLFSYLNSQMLGSQFTQAQFWEQALAPIREQIEVVGAEAPLAQQYRVCSMNGFGNALLNTLFRRLRDQGFQLVLLVDEFDVLLHHPILNCAEFFGGLRGLASQSKGALTLVIASGLPLARLNVETWH